MPLPITDDFTFGDLEIEIVRLGASMRAHSLTAADFACLPETPKHHRMCVFLTADSIAAFGTGTSLAEAAQDAFVRLRQALQRMHAEKKLPPHVVLHEPEILS